MNLSNALKKLAEGLRDESQSLNDSKEPWDVCGPMAMSKLDSYASSIEALSTITEESVQVSPKQLVESDMNSVVLPGKYTYMRQEGKNVILMTFQTIEELLAFQFDENKAFNSMKASKVINDRI